MSPRATTKKPAARKKAPVKKKPAAPAKKKAAPKKKPAVAKAKPAVTKAKPSVAKTKRAKKPPAAKKPRKRPVLATSGRVLDIVSDEQPIDALRWFLESVPGKLSQKNGQIALSAAQLMLLPIAREGRGSPEVHELLDIVLEAWDRFPDQTGFHAQELLRNALEVVGSDDEKLAALLSRVPEEPSPELQQAIAVAYALTHIPVDVARLVRPVRTAFDRVRATLEEFGEPIDVGPPVELDAVLAAERSAHIALPNDFRAMLTIANGCALFDRQFFSIADYRTSTALSRAARAYLEASPRVADCVPVAAWGPGEWLLYDSYGLVRADGPGYVLAADRSESTYDDLVAVLDQLGVFARDQLATN